MAARRRLDFCCLQETKWKGGQSRWLGNEGARYKFYWMGGEVGGAVVAGFGVMVAERWVDNVIEVCRVSGRLLI